MYVVQTSPWKPHRFAEPDPVLSSEVSEAEIQVIMQEHAQRFMYEPGAPAHEQYVDVLLGLTTLPPVALGLVLAAIVTVVLAR